jgi:hypothetical protein
MKITIDVTDTCRIVNIPSAQEWLELANPGDTIDFVAPDGSIVDTVQCFKVYNDWFACPDCGCSKVCEGNVNYIYGLCDLVPCQRECNAYILKSMHSALEEL